MNKFNLSLLEKRAFFVDNVFNSLTLCDFPVFSSLLAPLPFRCPKAIAGTKIRTFATETGLVDVRPNRRLFFLFLTYYQYYYNGGYEATVEAFF